MTDVFTAVETGIYTALVTAGSAFYSTRVYPMQAPLGAAVPHVRYMPITGGDQNVTPQRYIELTYQVECWGTAQADARTGAGHIDTALHNKILTVSGFTSMSCTAERYISTVENVDGKQYFRRGATYRIRLSE